MNKIFSLSISALAVSFALSSCSLFAIDNYEEPQETLEGKVVDIETGKPVLTEPTGSGIRVRLTELSWDGNVTPNDFYAKSDGTFRNTKIFKGHYNIRVDGPFIPIYGTATDGLTVLYDGTIETDIKGKTIANFYVQPFLNVEIVGEPVVSGGTVTAQVLVTRACTPADFKAKVAPTVSSYNPHWLDVTDVRLVVGYSNSVNVNNNYSSWTGIKEYGEGEFDKYLGTPITITSKGTLKAGRKMYIRAAARINFGTPLGSGTRRYNYSEVREINVPEMDD